MLQSFRKVHLAKMLRRQDFLCIEIGYPRPLDSLNSLRRLKDRSVPDQKNIKPSLALTLLSSKQSITDILPQTTGSLSSQFINMLSTIKLAVAAVALVSSVSALPVAHGMSSLLVIVTTNDSVLIPT
jgi:hypothetical protein